VVVAELWWGLTPFEARLNHLGYVIPHANRFYYLSAAKMNSKPVKEAN
jgi:hypothetical protein